MKKNKKRKQVKNNEAIKYFKIDPDWTKRYGEDVRIALKNLAKF